MESKDGSSSSKRSSDTKNVPTTKSESHLMKTLPAKNQLTGLLKPQSHESTPPPSRSSSSCGSHSNHKKTSHRNDHHKLVDPHIHSSLSSIERKVDPSLTDERKSLHSKTSKLINNKSSHHKTPEQLRMEFKKKFTPEQWEEYKKRKEKERLYHQKKKLAEREHSSGSASKNSSTSVKSDKTDGHQSSVRRSMSSLPSDSPVKKQRLDMDHTKKIFPAHDKSVNNTCEDRRNVELHQKGKTRLPDMQRSTLSGSDSDSSLHNSSLRQNFKSHHNSTTHNRLNESKHDKKVNGSKPLPPPPPPPKLNDTTVAPTSNAALNLDYSSSKLNTPHFGLFLSDGRNQQSRMSPPPPPPPVATKFV